MLKKQGVAVFQISGLTILTYFGLKWLGGSRSENLAAHTFQEFLGVSSLPNLKGKALGTRLLPAPVSVIHLSYHSDKY